MMLPSSKPALDGVGGSEAGGEKNKKCCEIVSGRLKELKWMQESEEWPDDQRVLRGNPN